MSSPMPIWSLPASSSWNVPACSSACVPFTLKDGRKVVKIADTLDFMTPLLSHLKAQTVGETITSPAPGQDLGGYYSSGEEGFSFDTNIGALYIDGLGPDNTLSLLNTKGFSIRVLTLLDTTYQTVPDGMNKQALAVSYLPKFLGTNCETIYDVKKFAKDVYTYRCELDERMAYPELHFGYSDANGTSGALEFPSEAQGEPIFHEDTIGILTNDPSYLSQLRATNGTMALSPLIPLDQTMPNGVVVQNYAIGGAMEGLQGGFSPTARFARLRAQVAHMTPAITERDATCKMWDLVSTVWTAPGTATLMMGDIPLQCHTYWASVKTLTDDPSISWMTYHSRTRQDGFPQIQTVKCSEYDFSLGAENPVIPLYADAEEKKYWEDQIKLYRQAQAAVIKP